MRKVSLFMIWAMVGVAPTLMAAGVNSVELQKDSLTTPKIVSLPIIERVVVWELPGEPKPLLALKTNLLYDAITALNIEIEVPIGERWSVAGEYIFPWWLSNKRQRSMQSLSGYIEGRYWLGNRTRRRQLNGWFVGLYAGGGYYDMEWNNKGYQGEFYIPVALSGGYAHSIGCNLSLEYSLGVGYMRTRYSSYVPTRCADGGLRLIRQRNDVYNYVGPTKIKVSLVWTIK